MSEFNYFKDCKTKQDVIKSAKEIIKWREQSIAKLEGKLEDIIRGHVASTEALLERLY